MVDHVNKIHQKHFFPLFFQKTKKESWSVVSSYQSHWRIVSVCLEFIKITLISKKKYFALYKKVFYKPFTKLLFYYPFILPLFYLTSQIVVNLDLNILWPRSVLKSNKTMIEDGGKCCCIQKLILFQLRYLYCVC